MRIDMHVHFMPRSMQADTKWYAQEPFWRLLVEPSGRKPVQGYASAQEMMADMDAAGIDQAVIQGEYYQTHEASVRRNDAVLDAVRTSGGRLLAFAAIQPKAGDKAFEELERCLDNGMLGVGEISPYAQGFALHDPDFMHLAEKCIEHKVPLLLHTNDEVGRYYKGKVPTPIRHFYALAERYPELKLILAHWGGGLFLYEIVPHVRKVLRNVVYDTAASPLLYLTESIFRAALACVSPSKIVYASDYPLLLYPGKQDRPDFLNFVSEIRRLNLDAADEAAILGGNAARILRPESDNPMQGSKPALKTTKSPADIDVISEDTSVSLIASTFPQTRAIFKRYGLEWKDTAVPPWEPVNQSAAAHSLNSSETSVLLEELNQAVESEREK